MFGVASVEQDDENIVSLLCSDANDIEDVYEREFTCKSVITNGRRRCAFNRKTSTCESMQDLVEDEVVKSIRTGKTRNLIPVAEFAEQQFARLNPDTNDRLNQMLGQLTNEMQKNRRQSKAFISIHPLAQLGWMLLMYTQREMIFTKLKEEPFMQQLTAIMGANALRMLFDTLSGSQDGSTITQLGTTLLKLFLPGELVTAILMGLNLGTVAGLMRYFRSKSTKK